MTNRETEGLLENGEISSMDASQYSSMVIKAEPGHCSTPKLNLPMSEEGVSLKPCSIHLRRLSFKDIILMCHGFDPQTYVEKRRLKLFCPFCYIQQPNISQLSRHAERKHSTRRNLSCKLCGKLFFFTYELLGHHRSIHDNKGLKCSYCERVVKSQLGLKIHEATHTGEKDYECSFCDKRFTSSYALTVHTRHHIGDRPYKCKFCSYASHSHSGLLSHKRLHTSEQPFKCSFCPKKFSLNTNRKAHERRIHTGERPYHCDYCVSSFFTKSDLNAHHWLHRPAHEAPYQCVLCERGFHRRDVWEKHSTRCNRKILQYKCDICFRCFQYEKQLLSHKAEKHN